MEKITLLFSSGQNLWAFKEQTSAINVTVQPKKNSITGLYGKQEINLAITRFNATTLSNQGGGRLLLIGKIKDFVYFHTEEFPSLSSIPSEKHFSPGKTNGFMSSARGGNESAIS